MHGNSEKINRVGLYTRVSTDLQDLEKQVSTLTKWAEKNSYEYKLYKDPGYSGFKFDRPSFNKLIDDVKQGNIDAVAVYKLDRMGRNTKEMLNLVDDLNKRNIKLISVTENIEPSTAMGRAFMQIMMVFSELERNVISERTRWGLQQIKEQNKDKPKEEQYHIGRPPKGYTSENGKLRPLTKEERQKKLKEKLKEFGYV